ncbi:protein DPCD [Anopheles cruzii]|uniref:protein DPCD n=1 Tax=Anopheles cruzii TaxID=68878 RepID=UPI0022EC993C|nr:protein DPCD [Anopheles cruzii]
MSYAHWLQLIRNAEKTSSLQGNVRQVHYRFPDGREMAEEYSTETGVIIRRAWKKKTELMRKEEWEIELGEPLPVGLNSNELVLQEAATEPSLRKRITRHAIEWRIRNVPYTLSTFSVTCDGDKKSVTIRTSNKKYFKTISVPEFERCNYTPKQEDLNVKHQNATLIVTYKKPPILLAMEKAVLEELQNLETMEYDAF